MKKIWTSLKKQKHLWLFFLIILICGIGVGVYFGFQSKELFHNTLANYALGLTDQSFHFSLTHFAILCSFFVLSFVLVGIPLSIMYLFYEGMTIGFCTTLFISSFQFGGFLYIFLFFLLTKFLFLILYFLFASKILEIGRIVISMVLYKTNYKERFIHYVLGCFVIIFIVLLVDLFLDFFGMKILASLGFFLR